MAELDGLYQELILDHAKRRVGAGLAPTGDGTAHERNPVCGDELTVRVSVADGVVREITWEGDGCFISQASASMMTQLASGRTVAQVRELSDGFRRVMRSRGTITLDEDVYGDAAALSGTAKYTRRVKCAMLAWVCLENALTEAG